jgi:hypothetical protein
MKRGKHGADRDEVDAQQGHKRCVRAGANDEGAISYSSSPDGAEATGERWKGIYLARFPCPTVRRFSRWHEQPELATSLRLSSRRRMISTTANAAAAIQSTRSIPRPHATPVAETPMPVAAVSQTARHIGHFGSNTSAAPGRIELTATESRRARRRLPGPPAQRRPVIMRLPCARSTPRFHAASHSPQWDRPRNRCRTCHGAAPMPS